MSEHLALGKSGEEAAVNFLEGCGYRILARNYKSKIGEIDIIALCSNVICFIEVKSRSSNKFGLAQEAVNLRKQRQISKAALCYLKENKLMDKKARFDVVSVDYSADRAKVEVIENAFELDNHYSY